MGIFITICAIIIIVILLNGKSYESKETKSDYSNNPGSSYNSSQSTKTQTEEKTINVDLDQIIVFDTETTGVNPNDDEILELAIINGEGKVLFNERLKPMHKRKWTRAQEINGISPEDVKDCKTIEEYKEQLKEIFKSAKVLVGYNVGFDKKFISAAGIKFKPEVTIDVMKDFSNMREVWDDEHHHNKWFKLEEAAAYYNYSFAAHSALEDTKATLFVFNKLQGL